MDRETKEIALPVSGMVAHIVTNWKYNEWLKIQAAQVASAGSLRMSIQKQQSESQEGTMDIDGDAMVAAVRKSILLAVKRLTNADGTEVTDIGAALDEMDMLDGVTLERAVDALDTSTGKK